MSKLQELIDQDLAGWRVAEKTEVVRFNMDTRQTESVGCFDNTDIALAYIDAQDRPALYSTQSALVLTNGKVGFVIHRHDPIHLFDDQAEVARLRQGVIAKLTPAQRRVLSISE